MSEHGIDESMRDDFVRHAVKFDDDDNLYLKKAEIIAAAEAWESSSEEAPAEEAPAEEAPAEEVPAEEAPAEEAPAEEAPAEEAPAEEAPTEESKDCPICGASNSSDATTCESCGFSF
jgi:ribosomal protein L40E